jgi:hypothetical protein
MKSLGIWLLILGVGAFILPLMGIQFRLVNLFGEAQYYVAGGMAAVGLVMVIAGKNSEE